ncbi:adenylyltransferase/cytidyltransferase family protein [Aliiglaciecola sp. LCG003]|uniref:adenylyltransferase/cytidyltransferase family protein n=1 Tax=Aliiglaciecola sp. LCG003 TaxID=3053655 RepID=UPI00257306C0|nr:adenylyltransferase/cytidyltransferase family protein [Aliiglaciecola sp. LCG003]WJG10581.1 adenylyltransferase/cytidyltransferase family protein [Aliiglaciecola sp. LCG003]
MKTILTYGTFDLLHVGHLNMLERLKSMGDKLIVGVSTDEFNQQKGKQSIFSFDERARIINALSCVDEVIPEKNWQQKPEDIHKYNVDIFGIGDDWQGKFDSLNEFCEVHYLSRTKDISSTSLKQALSNIDKEFIRQIKDNLDHMFTIVKAME